MVTKLKHFWKEVKFHSKMAGLLFALLVINPHRTLALVFVYIGKFGGWIFDKATDLFYDLERKSTKLLDKMPFIGNKLSDLAQKIIDKDREGK
ncbi:hypothetical protein [Salmonella phage SSBI34]|nr:hypothetical protein [Salmonella phage SSBI34]